MTNLAESYKEGCGSKRAVFPTIMMMIMIYKFSLKRFCDEKQRKNTSDCARGEEQLAQTDIG
jgi:hypothetical protein